MNIDRVLEQALCSDDIAYKKERTDDALSYYNQNSVTLPTQKRKKLLFTHPSYDKKCEIVAPHDLPTRKDFHTPKGLATLLHSIVHIEYSAIDLALDAVYRYEGMPREYYLDWLHVARDEIRHFLMLHELLESLGFAYGDFPVHRGLFDAGYKSASSILDRMAIVPRYFEASGLDVGPQIMRKLHHRRENPWVEELIALLEIIYQEEIDHVRKGDYWFKYLCKKEGIEEGVYFDILERYGLATKHRPHLNVQGRKEAGFSCEEIIALGARECE
jgi:uncharacterized ferritin-like protein (DUF455 family)